MMTAVFRAMGVAALIALLLLGSACGKRAAPTLEELKMPAERYAAVSEVVVRAQFDTRGEDMQKAAAIGEAMRVSGVLAAAQYRYSLSGEKPVSFRVKLDLFDSAARAAEQFRGRHMPEALAMTEALALGEDGFAFHNSYLGFRVGAIAVEIRAKPDDPRLRDFAASYAGFLQGLR